MKRKWLQHSPRPRVTQQAPPEDTALLSLSGDERRRIAMDSWEPSLLRQLLSAQDRLKSRKS